MKQEYKKPKISSMNIECEDVIAGASITGDRGKDSVPTGNEWN